MAGEPLMTITGTAGADCELRFLPNGTPVAAFSVAVTPRVRQGDEWKDGDTQWFRCTAWREMAEHCAETITKGCRVIVHGRFKTRQYTTKEGENRTSVEIDAEEVGPSLRYAVAQVKKMSRSGGGGGSGAPTEDPWSTGTPAGGSRGGSSSHDPEPPF